MAKLNTILTNHNSHAPFLVVHPLDDVPETKRSAEGPRPLTAGVRFSLFMLQSYLFVMGALVVYRALNLVGVLGRVG
jgi:hypothetical protein